MKQSRTQTEYVRRIKKALIYIDSHIDQSINLNDIARAGHFSAYHFHRIFHASVGDTVNDYVTRKRMEKAACRLLSTQDLSVTDVAELGGFSSSANFSKAFKLYFGVSPTALRQPDSTKDSKIGKLYRKYGKAFKPQDLYSQFITNTRVFDPNKLEELLMKIKIEEMQEKKIAYLSSPKGYQLESVYSTWEKIISWAKKNGVDGQKEQRFAICHDNPVITPEEKCRYDASIVINGNIRVAAPYEKSVIPSGKYAVAYFKDSAEKISYFMTELYAHWFPESGYEPDNFPPMFKYLKDSKEDGFVEMDVYIKIKKLEFG